MDPGEPLPPPGPWSSPAPAPRRFPWVNLALFLGTVATTILAGAALSGWNGETAFDLKRVLSGLPYASAILGILIAHELGHYLMARAWKVDTSLPYFVPSFPPVGTFGAVIRIRSAIPSRRAVLDIGAAGPIGGFLVALPLLCWGMAHSEIRPFGDAWLENAPGGGLWHFLAGWLSGAQAAPMVGIHYGDSLLTAAIQRLVLGPTPPGHEVVAHPVYMAAWYGLLVTTLNLLPVGQLDGGHVIYALLGGRRARMASAAVSWGLLAAGVFLSWNWLLWWAITRFVVRLGHPPALDERPLDRPRTALALLSLLLFAVTFIPVPVSM